MVDWQNRHMDLIVSRLSPFIGEQTMMKLMWTQPRFTMAVAVLFLFIFITCWRSVAVLRRNPAGPLPTMFVLLAGLYINVFTHTIQTLLLARAMTPGFLTAVLVVLPYTLMMFRRLVRARIVSKRAAIIVICSGPALFMLVGIADALLQ